MLLIQQSRFGAPQGQVSSGWAPRLHLSLSCPCPKDGVSVLGWKEEWGEGGSNCLRSESIRGQCKREGARRVCGLLLQHGASIYSSHCSNVRTSAVSNDARTFGSPPTCNLINNWYFTWWLEYKWAFKVFVNLQKRTRERNFKVNRLGPSPSHPDWSRIDASLWSEKQTPWLPGLRRSLVWRSGTRD